MQWRRMARTMWLNFPKCRLDLTVQHTGQESGCKLCRSSQMFIVSAVNICKRYLLTDCFVFRCPTGALSLDPTGDFCPLGYNLQMKTLGASTGLSIFVAVSYPASADILHTSVCLAIQTVLKSFLPECDYVTSGSLLSQIRLSSVAFVRPTQRLETFGNISSPLCTLAILWPMCKSLWRSS